MYRLEDRRLRLLANYCLGFFTLSRAYQQMAFYTWRFTEVYTLVSPRFWCEADDNGHAVVRGIIFSEWRRHLRLSHYRQHLELAVFVNPTAALHTECEWDAGVMGYTRLSLALTLL